MRASAFTQVAAGCRLVFLAMGFFTLGAGLYAATALRPLACLAASVAEAGAESLG